MQIVVTRYPGLCEMVERAIGIAEKAAEEFPDRKVYTLGRLANNDHVSERLKKRGIEVAEDISVPRAGDVLVISAHGASPEVYSEAESRGIIVRDATCPNIINIHNSIKKYASDGFFILIIGDKNHREIIGDAGYSESSAVAADAEEATEILSLKSPPKILVLFQTTFGYEKYIDISDKLKKFAENSKKSLVILKSICYTTIERQREAEKLSSEADFVIVVGDRGSSNTSKLLKIASAHSETALIEKISDLKSVTIKNNITKLAVLAGASTPKELTMEVIYTMEQNNTPDVAIDVNPTEVTEEKVAETVTEEVKAEETVVETAKEAEKEAPAEVKPVEKKKKEITTMEEAMKAGFAPKSYRENQRVKVTIESIDQTGVSVSLNLGGKNDAGFIAASEMELDGSFDPANYAVGETLEAIIIPKADSKAKTINLSKKKCDEILVGDAAAQHILNGEDFKLKITSVTKGGLLSKIGSYTIFVPASQIRMGFVKNLEDYVGKELRLRMLPPKEEEGGRKPNPKRIVASQRVILEEEKAEREDEFWANVVPGAVVEGKVKRFAQKDGKYFGIFVSVFNKDCLLHISDLSWTKVEDPSEVLKLNETYNFLVLKADREADKVSLGYKQLQKTPYQIAAEKYHVGDVVKGTVARIKDFGAFISLEPGIDGLVHVSEISHNYIKSAADALKVGDEVDAKIINFDKDKITLSIKACQEPEAVETVEKSDEERASGSRIAKFHSRAQGAEDQPKRRRRDEERDNEVHEYYSSGSTGATLADLFKGIDLSNFTESNDDKKEEADK